MPPAMVRSAGRSGWQSSAPGGRIASWRPQVGGFPPAGHKGPPPCKHWGDGRSGTGASVLLGGRSSRATGSCRAAGAKPAAGAGVRAGPSRNRPSCPSAPATTEAVQRRPLAGVEHVIDFCSATPLAFICCMRSSRRCSIACGARRTHGLHRSRHWRHSSGERCGSWGRQRRRSVPDRFLLGRSFNACSGCSKRFSHALVHAQCRAGSASCMPGPSSGPSISGRAWEQHRQRHLERGDQQYAAPAPTPGTVIRGDGHGSSGSCRHPPRDLPVFDAAHSTSLPSPARIGTSAGRVTMR